MMRVNKSALRKDMLTMQIKPLHVQTLPVYLRRLSKNLLKAEWSECRSVSGIRQTRP